MAAKPAKPATPAGVALVTTNTLVLCPACKRAMAWDTQPDITTVARCLRCGDRYAVQCPTLRATFLGKGAVR